MLTQLMYRLGLLKPFERLKLKNPNLCDFVKILKTECNLQYFTRNCRNKNLYDYKCEGERNDHMVQYEQVFGHVFEGTKNKCCGVLMKQQGKVKGEQVITFQLDQQPKILML